MDSKLSIAMSNLKNLVNSSSDSTLKIPMRAPPKKPTPKRSSKKATPVLGVIAPGIITDTSSDITLPGLPPSTDKLGDIVEIPKPLLIVPYRESPEYCIDDIDDNWSIIDIVIKKRFKGWEEIFLSLMDEFIFINRIILEDEDKYGLSIPRRQDIFRLYSMIPPYHIKVVVIGQDPYPDIEQAMGIAFSIRKGIRITGSLKNMYSEVKNCYPGFNPPSHGDLTYWVLQGVFLLNTSLTLRPGSPNSHEAVWMGLVIKTIELILSHNNECIFMLWGSEAQKLSKYISGRAKILECNHPSPRSVMQGGKDCFIGSKHFLKCNELLISQKKGCIDWNIPE